jgi:hypothetical protein
MSVSSPAACNVEIEAETVVIKRLIRGTVVQPSDPPNIRDSSVNAELAE